MRILGLVAMMIWMACGAAFADGLARSAARVAAGAAPLEAAPEAYQPKTQQVEVPPAVTLPPGSSSSEPEQSNIPYQT